MNGLFFRVVGLFFGREYEKALEQSTAPKETPSQVTINFVPIKLKPIVATDTEDGLAASIQETVLEQILKGERVPENLGSMIRSKIMEDYH